MLTHGVLWCTCEDIVIFLDTNLNRYSALEGTDARAWITLVSNAKNDHFFTENEFQPSTLLDELKAVGVICSSSSKPLPKQYDLKPNSRFSYILILFYGVFAPFGLFSIYLYYRWSLSQTSMRDTFEKLDSNLEFPFGEKYQQLVISNILFWYSLARKTIWTTIDDCYERSLILRFALQNAQISSRLIIGVENYPFNAHAWVEINGVPINDESSISHRYSQIANF